MIFRNRVAGVLLLAVLTAGCSEPSGPPGGDGLTLWHRRAESARTAPLVLDSVLVFGGFAAALGFDRESGELIWRRELGGTEVKGSTILGVAGLAIVPHWEIVALDPPTGEERWRFGGPDGGAGTRQVAAAGDTIFAGSAFGWASAIEGRTGEPYWSVDIGESLFVPAVSEELVIYGTRSFLGSSPRSGPYGAGHLVALRRADGSEAWRYPLPDSGRIYGGAVNGGAVWQDRVIVGSTTAWVHAVSLADGSLLWKSPNHEGPAVGAYRHAPVVIQDVAIFSRQNSLVEAWDVLDGTRRWTWSVPTSVSPPVRQGDYVYTFDGPITIGDATGAILWQRGGMGPTSGRGYWRGSVAPDGRIYSLGHEHFTTGRATYIYALDPPVKP